MMSIFSFIWGCDKDDSNIQFRIKNNIGEKIPRCYLGTLITKGSNSYSSKSYKVRWNDISEDELTDYKKIKGKLWGYNNCSIEFFGDNAKYPHQTKTNAISEAIKSLNIELVKDSIVHPYSKETIYFERLPDGKYTLSINEYDPVIAQTINISITKDE